MYPVAVFDECKYDLTHWNTVFVLAYFLWQLESPKPVADRRFFKRYLTFWHMYNICSDCFFLIGLLMKLMENLLVTENEGKLGMIDMNQLAASGRILWGAAFSLAILKTIKVERLIKKHTTKPCLLVTQPMIYLIKKPTLIDYLFSSSRQSQSTRLGYQKIFC